MPRAGEGDGFLLAQEALGETPQRGSPRDRRHPPGMGLCRPRVMSRQSVAWAERSAGRAREQAAVRVEGKRRFCQKGDSCP